MAVIQAKTEVLAGAVGNWIDTDGTSNIVVGVEGAGYTVEYNLGSDLIYGISAAGGGSRKALIVAKAAQVRVVSGKEDVNYEVFG